MRLEIYFRIVNQRIVLQITYYVIFNLMIKKNIVNTKRTDTHEYLVDICIHLMCRYYITFYTRQLKRIMYSGYERCRNLMTLNNTFERHKIIM